MAQEVPSAEVMHSNITMMEGHNKQSLKCLPVAVFQKKNVVQTVMGSLMFTLILLLYASRKSFFKMNITETNPPYKDMNNLVAEQNKTSQRDSLHQNLRALKNIPEDWYSVLNKVMSSEVLKYKEGVPKFLTYEQKTFLPNFRNPCWYEKNFRNQQKYLRCLPYFFIAGMPKCGTSDLFAMLVQHPVIELTIKEPHWWTRGRFKNSERIKQLDSYLKYYEKSTMNLKKFKTTNNSTGLFHNHIIGDSSASTLWDMHYWTNIFDYREPNFTTANIIKQLLPDVKLLVILRNPTDRLYSDYLYFSKTDKSAQTFHDKALLAISSMEQCMLRYGKRTCAYSYRNNNSTRKIRLPVGLYHIFIEDWLKVFPREQIMVIRLEDYTTNRTQYLKHITKFLKIEPYPIRLLDKLETEAVFNQRKKSDKLIGEMFPETRQLIDKFYQPFNEKLAEILVDEKFTWR